MVVVSCGEEEGWIFGYGLEGVWVEDDGVYLKGGV